MTRCEAVALVTLATAAYPSAQNKDPEPIVKAWAALMPDLEADLARKAVLKVCRSSKFFPSVAEILAAAEELDPRHERLPTAAEAWEEVVKLIRVFGAYKAPAYSCNLVMRATEAIGWRTICLSENPEADRAHFLRMYAEMRDRHQADECNKKVLQIAGVGDLARHVAEKLKSPA